MYNSFSRVGALALTLAVLFFGIVTAASAVPTNDAFANRQTLTDAVEATTNVGGATLEANEILASCSSFDPMDWSVWYTFTAPATGDVVVTAKLPTPNELNYVAVYELNGSPTAQAPGTEVGCNRGQNFASAVVSATSGTSYAVQFAGKTSDLGDDLTIEYSTTGTLSGTVTEQGTGTPLENIYVQVTTPTGGTSEGGAYTAADGTWSANVQVGDVVVQFIDSSGGVYATQYYDGVTTNNDATVLTVTTGSSTSGIDAALDGSGDIVGTITDGDGNPIAGAQATLYTTSLTGGPVKLGFTDANGDYSLDLVTPGNYLIKFSAAGFFTEWFDDQPDSTTATVIQVQAGQTGTFDAVLVGAGNINGVITDDLGDPVSGAIVKIFAVPLNQGDTPVATGISSGLGDYASDNPLPPGDYKVFVDTDQVLDGGYGSEWWDDQSFSTADTITLGSGQTFLADFAIQRTIVSGMVTSSADTLPIEGVTVTLEDAIGDQIGQLLTDASGNYGFLKVPTVNSPLTLTFDGSSVVYGTATESGSISSGDVQTINVELDSIPKEPVIGPGGLSPTIAENVGIGSTVTSLTATDENRADTLTWSITGGNTGGAFSIDPSSGVVSTAKALDFETTPSYSLTVQVSDGSLTDTATVTVTVTDVNETPTIGAGGRSGTVAENVAVGTTVTSLSATDPDADTLTWSITGGNTGGAFTINSSSGVIKTAKALDFETTSSYSLTVQVSDGSLTDMATVAVTVTDKPEVTGPSVERLFGSNRYRTGVAVSSARFPGTSSVVFIATGGNFPDALVAAAPAGNQDAPVLLVAKNSVDSSVMAELRRLSPSKIFVIGGSAVISDSVAATLTTVAPVTRLSGSNRYSTAVDVSKEFYGPSTSSVFIATGSSFPDALVGAAPAARDGSPILLVPKGSVPSDVFAEIVRLSPSKIYILGGTAVVSDDVASTLGTIASVTRLAGSNRFGTADAVATALFPSAAGVDSAYLATAYNFPDALVAAAAAGKEGGPVLLTAKDSLTGYANTQIRRLKPADVFIIGGTAVVGDAVLNAVDW